jgi:hypothetical protein
MYLPGPSGIKLPLLRHFSSSTKYCISVAVARGLTSSQRGKTSTLTRQVEDVEVDIGLSQVNRVANKRPKVKLGDGGYGNHDARGVMMPSPGEPPPFEMTPRSLAGIGTSARPASRRGVTVCDSATCHQAGLLQASHPSLSSWTQPY